MSKVAKLIAIMIFVQFTLIISGIVQRHTGCERGKLDRIDNADFQRAQATYISSVTGAASVKEDVKNAARTASITFERTSSNLEKRSHVNCWKVF